MIHARVTAGAPAFMLTMLATHTCRCSGRAIFGAAGALRFSNAALDRSSPLFPNLAFLALGLDSALRSTRAHRGTRPFHLSPLNAAATLKDSSGGCYWMGNGTPRVSREMHADNRARVLSHIGSDADLKKEEGGLIVVEGGRDQARADTDHELLFRQESNFHYLFGVEHPGCYGAIDVATGEATLFVPRVPSEYTVWMGPPPTLEEVKANYKVDGVQYVDELPKFVSALDPPKLYLYGGANSDSGARGKPATFDGVEGYDADTVRLHRALHECRVLKSEAEIEILRHASRVASEAHVEMMRHCRPGMMEYQLESIFKHHCYLHGGMRNMAYTPISGSGTNAAVLHYGHAGSPNDREMTEGDLVLCDMGGEYYCYASDITTSFPVNGRFTPTQRAVYEAVLEAKDAVIARMKPGVSWIEMHELAEEVLARHLIKMGLLTGSLEEVVRAGLPAVFMPHGLGHNLGLETHDVGGVPEGAVRPTRPGLRSLRNVRTLRKGMVLTVEPGCYFIPSEINKALVDPDKGPLMNEEGLSAMFGFGGVRLEDNVLVTEEGADVFTDVPRSIDEVEAIVGSAYD